MIRVRLAPRHGALMPGSSAESNRTSTQPLRFFLVHPSWLCPLALKKSAVVAWALLQIVRCGFLRSWNVGLSFPLSRLPHPRWRWFARAGSAALVEDVLSAGSSLFAGSSIATLDGNPEHRCRAILKEVWHS